MSDTLYWGVAVLCAGVIAFGFWNHYNSGERLAVSGRAIIEMEQNCQCEIDLDCSDFFSQEKVQNCYDECLRITGTNFHDFEINEEEKVCVEFFNQQ